MMKKPVKIKDRNPFRVPEGYFEEVNRKIISATSGTSKTESGPAGSRFCCLFYCFKLYGN
jgi:hypothetical protein